MRILDMFGRINTDTARLHGLVLLTCCVLSLTACTAPNRTTHLAGQTMGTTYRLTYASTAREVRYEQQAVDSLLENINASMSTYLPTSLISEINASEDTAAWRSVDLHFEAVFQRSLEIYKDTGGAFNPAVGPLVIAWGFGPREIDEPPDNAMIRRLLRVVSLENFDFRKSPPALRKRNVNAQLDFSAIAKGYAVDAVARLLEQWGVQNYSVEIGGEVKTRGSHPDGHAWRVAIERPADDADSPQDAQIVVALHDASLATSGNYRNYLTEGDKRFGHILDPRTGYPEMTDVVSVTVLARDVTSADAYATALMVMGSAEGLKFVESRRNLEAYFITRNAMGQLFVVRSAGFPEPTEE